MIMSFKIGIFGATRERALRAFEQYVEKIDYDQIKYIRKSMIGGRAECELFNGVKITALAASDNARGYKFDRIIYDDEMDFDRRRCIVEPCLLTPMRSFSFEGLD